MFSVGDAINARLDIAREEKEQLRSQLKTIDSKFKIAIGAISKIKRPNMSEKEVLEAIRRKEHIHATTSQSNADERNFMHGMEKLNQQRKDAAEYARLQSELDIIKAQRQSLTLALREKDALLDDLHTGIRKVTASNQLNCPPTDIKQFKCNVPVEAMKRIYIKAGHNMKKIEEAHNVLIDADRGGSIRICGLQANIDSAYELIIKYATTITEDCKLQSELMSCLKVPMILEMQERHGVRIECTRSTGNCRITGSREAIDEVKEELRKLPVMKIEISVAKSSMPFVIGKGGATIRSMRETFEVDVDSPKGEENSSVVILGLKDNVLRATQFLNTLIDENAEISNIIESEKHVLLGCVSGGNILPSLQKELNVRLKLQGENKNMLCITGNKAQVNNAKLHILAMLEKHKEDTIVVSVPEYVTPIILGRKGAKIKQLREEHSDVTLDVIDSSILHIAGGTLAGRQAALRTINAIIESNIRQSIELPDRTISLLKGIKGAKCRAMITNDLQLNMDIVDSMRADESSAVASQNGVLMGLIRLKGPTANVTKGIDLLREFKSNNHILEISAYSEDDCGVVQTFLSKQLESKYNVEIMVNRSRRTIQIRGKQDVTNEVSNAIKVILEGNDASQGAYKISVSPLAFPSLIGKGGVTIQKFENDYDVKIDVLRGSNEIRVRGNSEQKVLAAKTAMQEFLNAVRISESVMIPSKLRDETDNALPLVSEVVSICTKRFGVAAEKYRQNISMRGRIDLLDAAKLYIDSVFNNYLEKKLKLVEAKHYSYLHGKAPGFSVIKEIENEYFGNSASGDLSRGVILDNNSCYVYVRGDTETVRAAYSALFSRLQLEFPFNYQQVNFEPKCLTSLTYIAIQEIREATRGVNLSFDYSESCVRVWGSEDEVFNCVDYLNQKKFDFEDRHAVVHVDEGIVGALLAKKASKLLSLGEETNTNVQFDRDLLCLCIEGETRQIVDVAVVAINKRLDDFAKEYWEYEMFSSYIGAFLGKGGSNIKNLRAETGAFIDMQPDTRMLTVSGSADAVSAARTRILDMFADFEAKDYSCEVDIPDEALPLVVGTKGAAIRSIEDKSGARIDINRSKHNALLRGTKDACRDACMGIQEVLQRGGFYEAAGVIIRNHNLDAVVVTPVNAHIVSSFEAGSLGSTDNEVPTTITTAAVPAVVDESKMSKSALRRKRRKEKEELAAGGTDKAKASGVINNQAKVVVPETKAKSSTTVPATVPAAPVSAPASVSEPEPFFSSLLSDTNKGKTPSPASFLEKATASASLTDNSANLMGTVQHQVKPVIASTETSNTQSATTSHVPASFSSSLIGTAEAAPSTTLFGNLNMNENTTDSIPTSLNSRDNWLGGNMALGDSLLQSLNMPSTSGQINPSEPPGFSSLVSGVTDLPPHLQSLQTPAGAIAPPSAPPSLNSYPLGGLNNSNFLSSLMQPPGVSYNQSSSQLYGFNTNSDINQQFSSLLQTRADSNPNSKSHPSQQNKSNSAGNINQQGQSDNRFNSISGFSVRY